MKTHLVIATLAMLGAFVAHLPEASACKVTRGTLGGSTLLGGVQNFACSDSSTTGDGASGSTGAIGRIDANLRKGSLAIGLLRNRNRVITCSVVDRLKNGLPEFRLDPSCKNSTYAELTVDP